MGFLTSAGDTLYTFRFIKLLATKWADTPAYTLGIIDDKGEPQKKVRDLTSDERSVYTMFHRLVYKLKRLMNKVPGGKSTLASYAAALWLIKENSNLSEDQIKDMLQEYVEFDAADINESFSVNDSNELLPGIYKLKHDILSPITAESIAEANDKIVAHGNEVSVGSIFGYNVFEVQHSATKQMIFVTSKDLIR